jgi:hypothetical protein
MPSVEKKRKPLSRSYWITYKLQGLSTAKFLDVVQRILSGEYILLKPAERILENPEIKEEEIVCCE